MTDCEAVQRRLAEDGVEAAESQEDIQRHLEDCDTCPAFLADLRRVEAALGDLSTHDAPDALVADTLRAVRKRAAAPPAKPRASRYIAIGFAASLVVTAGLGLTLSRNWMQGQVQPTIVQKLEAPPIEIARLAQKQKKSEVGESEPMVSTDFSRAIRKQIITDRPLQEGAGERIERELDIIAMLDESSSRVERGARATTEEFEEDAQTEPLGDFRKRAEPVAPPAGAKTKADGGYGDEIGRESEPFQFFGQLSNEEFQSTTPREYETHAETLVEMSDLRADQPASVEQAGREAPQSRVASDDEKQVSEKARDKDRAAGLAGSDLGADPAMEGESIGSGTVGGQLMTEDNKRMNIAPPAASDAAGQRARDFLARIQSLDGLAFQEPVGYWANSYIPGDPAMRLLQARLQNWNRAALGRNVQLEQTVRQVSQPFDAPQDAAMAVYLNADVAAIEGPTRLRVQIGLKGAERQGGHRPAMNIGLVVDMRGVAEADSGARVRALIAALERARQPEDRFSLTMTGPGGGLLVPPDGFKHGPLRVAMDQMFGPEGEAAPFALDLPQAVALAAQTVRQGDDPTAVLGSSLVLLVTGASLTEDLAALERMAHENAVGGVPLSVVSLAAGEDLAHIDRLVAAGQGNRRVLDSARAAEALIDRELHAASRAVARALRLRIRLAPGVKLVEVLDSRRLGELRAQRVRDAEQSIDKRLARNLGIEADRGEDEEGIQIVIPGFQAGDTHVILLDLVAEGPGPVADVTLRYKDTVYLGNGVARANLTIGAGRDAPGPLERNVLKNLVAWDFAQQTRQAGRYLAAGDPRSAEWALIGLRDLIVGLRREVAGWASDPDLAADQAMLDDYLAVFRSPAIGDAVQRQYLADSLSYAAFRKLQAAR